MQRRDFLKRTLQAGAVLPLAGSALVARPLATRLLEKPTGNDRVLVLINLSGGNDGLNTVIPFEDATYYNARASIAIPKSDVLRLDGTLGLHPSMSAARDLYTAGQCAIVQSVGYA